MRGAYASKGGKSFICLSSTYEKRGERRSRIVFDLTPGNIVTTPRSDVMYVVTEFGMVNLKGKVRGGTGQGDHCTRASRFPRRSGTAGLRKPIDSARCFVWLSNGPSPRSCTRFKLHREILSIRIALDGMRNMHADTTATATQPFVLSTVANGVATLTLNRPERFNPLSYQMISAIGRA